MIALLLVLGTFLYLTFVGQAVVALLRPRLGVLWSWFIAPTVGLAILIVLITRLNVWGIPVRVAGPWLTLGLFVAAAGIFIWRRPKLPWRQLAPFFGIVCVYLLYVGWPAVRFGFNWISYGNDDMANYCLAAERFLNHGYYDLPLQTDLEGRNYTQHYWFMHGLQQIRPGSELAVAWVSSLTGLKAHQTFMPTILMLSMLQIFALGAVSIFKGRYRKVTLVAFFLFATSPLFGLGTLYQLIAQVGGIAILLAAASVLFATRHMTWRKLALGGLITGCLAIYYPEVAPFVALGIGICALRLRYTDRTIFNRYALFIAGVAALTFLLIATNTYQFINTLVMQSVGSAGLGAMAEINDQSGGLVLFPWTLVPSFLPMLFGLHAFGVVGTDPLISILIALSFGFLIFMIVRAWKNVREGAPAGYLGALMLFLGFYLFNKGQDFGLFKLAMFAQPVITLFLAQGFALYLFGSSAQHRRWAAIALVVFFARTIWPHAYYTYASLGTYGGGLTEVVGASRLGVSFTPPKDLKFDAIESDINNVVTAKMLAQYTQGIDTRFLSRSYMDNIANIAVLKFLRTPDPDLGPQARIIEKLSLLRFLLPEEIMTGDVPDYKVMSIQKLDNNWTETSSRNLNYKDRLLVSVRRDLDHFNKANPGTGWVAQNMFQYKLESQVKDHLVFIHSELSPHYYSSARFKAAFFQREPEPITHGDVYFHGSGRYNLFNIIHPSPNLRLIVDFSRTSLGKGRSKLPSKAIVVGEKDYPLPFVGHGSARVVSPPLKPEYFEQNAYITLDFGEVPSPIEKEKTGLMRLWGLKFNLDDRRLVGFMRDASVITEEQYLALPRPTKINDFPGDLARYPGLEYSGLFEDGWVAEDAFFKLGPSRAGQILTFKGTIPETKKFREQGVDVTVSINEKPTEIVNLKSGAFTLTRLIKEATQITSISLHFSDAQVYGTDDPRAVSASITEISIGDLPDLTSFRKLVNQKGDKFDLTGVDEDGWIARRSTFNAPAFDTFKVLKIDLEMPGWAPVAANGLDVTVNGRVIDHQDVARTSYVSLLLPLTAQQRTAVTLDAGNVFSLPNEKRERAFLIKNISFENLSPTDLFARGWHRSGYLFKLDRADNDGWVDRHIAFDFPATKQFKTAIIEVIRFPAKADLPLSVGINGAAQPVISLGLEKTERITVALSSEHATGVTLDAPRNFALAAPDTRLRSFRIVNIDFQ
ncbi:MAG: hypothetical protein WCG63_04035 [Opitutaceae bacterium]